MTEAREVYCGADLHGNNVVLSFCDQHGHTLRERRVASNLEAVLGELAHYDRDEMAGVTVESTYNWYWFVDGLQEEDLKVSLANPAGLSPYTGLKESDDGTDARWLAELTRLKIVPEGYIYPKNERAVRDVLRRRRLLVRQRTGLLNSLAAWRARYDVSRKDQASADRLEELGLEGWVVYEAELLQQTISMLSTQIDEIERRVHEFVCKDPGYGRLEQIKGIGLILGATILLESGDFSRFARASNYASYARTVRSRRSSNGKRKGSNNARNGNPHLAWAFAEAGHFVKRYDDRAAGWFERKKKRSNEPIAHKALASKLAKAVWHVMQGEPYQPERLFN